MGKGSVLGIKAIYKTTIIKKENIDNIDPTIILPDYIKRKVVYLV